MEDVVKQLLSFSRKILDLGDIVTDDRIGAFERKYNLHLPRDFKNFITRYNGLNLMGMQVYGFDEKKDNSIENIYDHEHFCVSVPQYPNLVPFSSDGSGNFYCLDTSEVTTPHCPIVFWVSNYRYFELDPPEPVNDSFEEWMKEVLIGWTLEDYNYDGTAK